MSEHSGFKKSMEQIKAQYFHNVSQLKKQFGQKVDFYRKLADCNNSQPSSQAYNNALLTQFGEEQKQYFQKETAFIKEPEKQIEKISKGTKKSKNVVQFHSPKPRKIQDNLLEQWNYDQQHSFRDAAEMKQNYWLIEMGRSLGTLGKGKNQHDFKQDEKNLLTRIFTELTVPNQKRGPALASLKNILQFFRNFRTFYYFYNIHPDKAEQIFAEAAKTKKGFLTQLQFLKVCVADRATLKDYESNQMQALIGKCVLEQEGWSQLYCIFSNFDTFGNQTIHIQPFLHRIENSPHLLNMAAIQYLQLGRTYPLRKLIFQLRQKHKLKKKICWKEIVDLISNFKHKEEPSIDRIYAKNVKTGNISANNNCFLIDGEVIEALKSVYSQCKKFAGTFVSKKALSSQLQENKLIEVKGNKNVRKGLTCVSVSDACKLLQQTGPNFIDLDEFLEFFSIKGPQSLSVINYEQLFDNPQSSSDEDSDRIMEKKLKKVQQKQKQRKNKEINRINKRGTIIQEFHFNSRTQHTIRQKRLKQMLRQKEEEQLKELSNKFKAEPLPAQLNPQRYKSYVAKQEQKRFELKQQWNRKREEDAVKLKHIIENTKLLNFQRKSPKLAQVLSCPKFVHTPVPWFAKQDMLSEIVAFKKQRRELGLAALKSHYQKAWSKLRSISHESSVSEDSILNKIEQTGNKSQYKTREVPNFQELHRTFAEELQHKKQHFKPTSIQEFHFSAPRPKKPMQFSHSQICQSNKDNFRRILTSPHQQIPTTLKQQQCTQTIYLKMQQRQYEKRMRAQEIKIKKKKQKNFARFMRRAMRAHKAKINQNEEAMSPQEYLKLKWQQMERQNQQELTQMYARVMQRPFLFQGCDPNMAKTSKTKGKVRKIQTIEASDQWKSQIEY